MLTSTFNDIKMFFFNLIDLYIVFISSWSNMQA